VGIQSRDSPAARGARPLSRDRHLFEDHSLDSRVVDVTALLTPRLTYFFGRTGRSWCGVARQTEHMASPEARPAVGSSVSHVQLGEIEHE
jgi:hypothetical protein